MTVSDQSVTGTMTPDGANGTNENITVPAGELWYVDAMYVATDGGGSETTFKPTIGVYATTGAADAHGPFYNNSPRGNGANVDVSATQGQGVSVGGYATAGEEIRVGHYGDGGGGGTVEYAVEIRRIL